MRLLFTPLLSLESSKSRLPSFSRILRARRVREKMAQKKNGPKNGLSKSTQHAVASNAIDPKVKKEKINYKKRLRDHSTIFKKINFNEDF